MTTDWMAYMVDLSFSMAFLSTMWDRVYFSIEDITLIYSIHTHAMIHTYFPYYEIHAVHACIDELDRSSTFCCLVVNRSMRLMYSATTALGCE